MTPEPTNPHDPDAIRVEFEHEEGKYFHLGYLPNADTICLDCAKQWDRMSDAEADRDSCMRDKHKHNLARHGTATRLKGYFGGEAYAVVTEITGGEDGQSLGCNLALYAEE